MPASGLTSNLYIRVLRSNDTTENDVRQETRGQEAEPVNIPKIRAYAHVPSRTKTNKIELFLHSAFTWRKNITRVRMNK